MYTNINDTTNNILINNAIPRKYQSKEQSSTSLI